MLWGAPSGTRRTDSVDAVGVGIVSANRTDVSFEHKIDYGGRTFDVGGRQGAARGE